MDRLNWRTNSFVIIYSNGGNTQWIFLERRRPFPCWYNLGEYFQDIFSSRWYSVRWGVFETVKRLQACCHVIHWFISLCVMSSVQFRLILYHCRPFYAGNVCVSRDSVLVHRSYVTMTSHIRRDEFDCVFHRWCQCVERMKLASHCQYFCQKRVPRFKKTTTVSTQDSFFFLTETSSFPSHPSYHPRHVLQVRILWKLARNNSLAKA